MCPQIFWSHSYGMSGFGGGTAFSTERSIPNGMALENFELADAGQVPQGRHLINRRL
ncbi:MAG: hypothetical protein LBB79_08430 [Prevotellaceae bacterium]|nr:hypothetical protein [Prevotellaceae bacterium]